MLVEDAESHGPAVILHVQSELNEADLLQKFLHDLGRLIEGVSEFLRIRHFGVAEAWIVRRHDVEFVRQRRHQITVLVRGSWEAMQQHQLRHAGLAGFPIENLQTFEFDRFEQHRSCSVPD